jgi:hypothetical protein
MEDLVREYKMKTTKFNKIIKEFATLYSWSLEIGTEAKSPAHEPMTEITFHAPGKKEDFYCKYNITTEFYYEYLHDFFTNLNKKGN